jgi:hypothetical protein
MPHADHTQRRILTSDLATVARAVTHRTFVWDTSSVTPLKSRRAIQNTHTVAVQRLCPDNFTMITAYFLRISKDVYARDSGVLCALLLDCKR